MSFSRVATVPCSTKRPPPFVGNIRGPSVEQETGLFCEPVMPVDPDTKYLPVTDSPFELDQTFLQGVLDIKKGDILVITATSKEYLIKAVAKWPRGDIFTYHLFIQDEDND